MNFQNRIIEGIRKIFLTSNCYLIYAGGNSTSEPYCEFSDGGINSRTGLIYISNADQVAGKDAEDLVYAGVHVQTAYFVDEQWIYYEGIPFHAMD